MVRIASIGNPSGYSGIGGVADGLYGVPKHTPENSTVVVVEGYWDGEAALRGGYDLKLSTGEGGACY